MHAIIFMFDQLQTSRELLSSHDLFTWCRRICSLVVLRSPFALRRMAWAFGFCKTTWASTKTMSKRSGVDPNRLGFAMPNVWPCQRGRPSHLFLRPIMQKIRCLQDARWLMCPAACEDLALKFSWMSPSKQKNNIYIKIDWQAVWFGPLWKWGASIRCIYWKGWSRWPKYLSTKKWDAEKYKDSRWKNHRKV